MDPVPTVRTNGTPSPQILNPHSDAAPIVARGLWRQVVGKGRGRLWFVVGVARNVDTGGRNDPLDKLVVYRAGDDPDALYVTVVRDFLGAFVKVAGV